jgi:hypothetical protein
MSSPLISKQPISDQPAPASAPGTGTGPANALLADVRNKQFVARRVESAVDKARTLVERVEQSSALVRFGVNTVDRTTGWFTRPIVSTIQAWIGRPVVERLDASLAAAYNRLDEAGAIRAAQAKQQEAYTWFNDRVRTPLIEAQWFKRVDNILQQADRQHLREAIHNTIVVQNAHAFYDFLVAKYADLVHDEDGQQVSLSVFAYRVKADLGATWSDRLVQPLTEFYESFVAASTERVLQIGERLDIPKYATASKKRLDDLRAQVPLEKYAAQAWSPISSASALIRGYTTDVQEGVDMPDIQRHAQSCMQRAQGVITKGWNQSLSLSDSVVDYVLPSTHESSAVKSESVSLLSLRTKLSSRIRDRSLDLLSSSPIVPARVLQFVRGKIGEDKVVEQQQQQQDEDDDDEDEKYVEEVVAEASEPLTEGSNADEASADDDEEDDEEEASSTSEVSLPNSPVQSSQ